MLKRLRHPLALAGALLIIGFGLEALSNGLAPSLRPAGLSWPHNLYLLLIVVFALLILHLRFSATPLVRFLSGIPAALASLLLLFAITLPAGILPQHQHVCADGAWHQLFGLHRLVSSVPFIVAGLFLLLTLGLATLRRMTSRRRAGQLDFLCNHLGLWLAVAGIFFGQGDLREARIAAREGLPSLQAEDETGRPVQLPFGLRLEKFIMEEHPSRPALYDPHTGAFQPIGKDGRLPEPHADWRIAVLEYLPDAVRDSEIYRAASGTVTAAAARVEAVNAHSGERREGWVSFGNHLVPPATLALERALITLEPPRAKRYASLVTILPREGEPFEAMIEVNHPLAVAGWKLYQFSYDQELGRWSPVSIISARRDPWLPVVYTGFWLLVAGSALLLWNGPLRTAAAPSGEA